MGHDQNFCDLSVNAISSLTLCVKREIYEWQFSPFILDLGEKLVNYKVNSRKITEFL